MTKKTGVKMKFRIKRETNKNDETYYYPEYKDFLFWYRFKRQNAFDVYFDSKEACEKYLDELIKGIIYRENVRIIIRSDVVSMRELK